MDSQGNYTDRRGRPLTERTRVRMSIDGGDFGVPVGSVGMIETLPKEGNDWHGYPHVRFEFDNKARHIPDTSLERLDPDASDTAGQLEAMIASVAASNAAMRTFLDRRA